MIANAHAADLTRWLVVVLLVLSVSFAVMIVLLRDSREVLWLIVSGKSFIFNYRVFDVCMGFLLRLCHLSS